MASAVSSASLADDSNMTSVITSSPTKKSWLEIRLVCAVHCYEVEVPFSRKHLQAVKNSPARQ